VPEDQPASWVFEDEAAKRLLKAVVHKGAPGLCPGFSFAAAWVRLRAMLRRSIMGAHEPERPERDLEETEQDRKKADVGRGMREADQAGRKGGSKPGPDRPGLEQGEEAGRQAGQS
jgi:hypothetical protein